MRHSANDYNVILSECYMPRDDLSLSISVLKGRSDQTREADLESSRKVSLQHTKFVRFDIEQH